MKQVFLLLAVLIVASPAQAKRKVKKCNRSEDRVVWSNFTFGSNHWRAFERYAERRMDINIKGCLRRRFQRNGKVVCRGRSRRCRGKNAYAAYLSKKMNVCPTFRRRVRRLSSVRDRKACWFALMVHEFAHTCWRGHRRVEPLDNLAFQFAANRFGSTANMLRDCGMD